MQRLSIDFRRFAPFAGALAACIATPARAVDQLVNFRGSASWINAYTHNQVSETDRDPDGTTLGIPSDRLTSELRPNFKFVTNDLQVVARPRLSLYADRTNTKDMETGNKKAGVFKSSHAFVWSEAFAQWTMS